MHTANNWWMFSGNGWNTTCSKHMNEFTLNKYGPNVDHLCPFHETTLFLSAPIFRLQSSIFAWPAKLWPTSSASVFWTMFSRCFRLLVNSLQAVKLCAAPPIGGVDSYNVGCGYRSARPAVKRTDRSLISFAWLLLVILLQHSKICFRHVPAPTPTSPNYWNLAPTGLAPYSFLPYNISFI